MAIKQTQILKTTQTLTPQQILFTRLLEVPSFMLEQRIQQELMNNPALDIAENEEEENENLDEMDYDNTNGDDFESPNDTEQELEDNFDNKDDFEELFAEEDDSRDELYRNISNHAADDEVREMPLASRDSFQASSNPCPRGAQRPFPDNRRRPGKTPDSH